MHRPNQLIHAISEITLDEVPSQVLTWMAWKLDGNKLGLDVTLPTGAEADIIPPTQRFDQPHVTLNGVPATGWIHVKEGRSQLELTGVFNPTL